MLAHSKSPQNPAWHPGNLAWVGALAALVAVGAFVMLADDSEASHYWAGTLQWNHTPETGTVLDEILKENAPIAYFSGRQGWRWSALSSLPECSATTGEGMLQFSDGGSESFQRLVTHTDSRRDLVVVKLVSVGADPVLACDDSDSSSTYHIKHTFTSPNQGPGVPHKVWWTSCCRIGYGWSGNYHVNNNDQSEWLQSFVDLEDPNRSPIVKLAPLRYCPIDAMCRFRIEASDPDKDRLTFRMSKSSEALPSGTFHQPGPSCGRCSSILYEMEINKNTGWATWDTTGAEIVETTESARNLYSTQMMVEDGTTSVPVDFMIELIEPPEILCPDGSVPPIDDWTGEYRYDLCDKELTCEDPEMAADPSCQYPPDWEFNAPPGPTPRVAPEWYLPGAPPAHGLGPGVSGGQVGSYSAADRVDWSVALRDSDGDGLVDRSDACTTNELAGASDFDGDGLGDGCDPDMDGDGLFNAADPCPLDATNTCEDAEASTLEAKILGDQKSSAASQAPIPGREQSQVQVTHEEAKKSPVGWIMLAVLGAALLVLLLGMALRRRD